MSIKVYHNPRCSKSRMAIQLLDNHQINYDTKLYMKEQLNKVELTNIIKALGVKPEQLLRKKEKIYIDEYKDRSMNDDDIIQAMLTHPQLIERPIVIDGKKGVIGRPTELIESFLKLA